MRGVRGKVVGGGEGGTVEKREGVGAGQQSGRRAGRTVRKGGKKTGINKEK